MNTHSAHPLLLPISPRKAAIVAGVSLLLMAVAAGFAYGYVYSELIVPGDPEATIGNLRASGSLFRAGVAGWIIIFILDAIVAWMLFLFLRKVDFGYALLIAWLRLVYTAILGGAIVNFIFILKLLKGGVSFAPELAPLQVMFHLRSFEEKWSMGLIIFGLHLLMLGYLALRSKIAHAFWGILLVVAGICYLFVHGAQFLHLDLAGQLPMVETALSLPMALGELGFAIWLIVRGGRNGGFTERI